MDRRVVGAPGVPSDPGALKGVKSERTGTVMSDWNNTDRSKVTEADGRVWVGELVRVSQEVLDQVGWLVGGTGNGRDRPARTHSVPHPDSRPWWILDKERPVLSDQG